MTRDDFMRAVRARPADDAPRLVFADWLDEHGDACRAEFIRVQCELAHAAPGPRRAALETREAALLNAHRPAWTEPVRPLVLACTFRRGFLASVRLTARQLAEHGDALFRLAPLAETEVEAWPDDVGLLADCPHLARAVQLEVKGRGLGDAGAGVLAASPYVAGLSALVLHYCGLGPASAEALAAVPWTRLAVLNLGANDLRDEGAVTLARAPSLRRVGVLGLGANQLTAVGAAALAASPSLTRLTRLTLRSNYLDDAGAAALAGAANLASLTELELSGNEFGDAGAFALAESPHLGGLALLDVTATRVGAVGREALRARFGDRVRV
jgi:uncharacterized protein (TIGR02996 family)